MDTLTKTRLTLRLEGSIYARAANLASQERRSLNSQLEMLIELGLTALEPLDGVSGPDPLPGQTSIDEITPAEAKRQRKKPLRKEMCVHRVPAGSWCKRCDE